MALGAVLVLAAVIGGIVVLSGGGDDDSGSATSEADSSQLTQRLTKQDSGLSGFYPQDWRRTEKRGITNLVSPDSCIAISLSAPATAAQSGALLNDSIAALRRSFKQTEVRRQPGAARIGGLPTRGALVAVSRQGRTALVELSVGRGKRFAYLTEVVLREPPCEGSIGLGRQIIGSLQFTR
jgi:hypothetical protein